MTWRERIQAARERGAFTEEDRWLVVASETCAVGEVTKAAGRDHEWYIGTALPDEEQSLIGSGWTLGTRHSAEFTAAVLSNRIAEADGLLDAIEDRALALKRGSPEEGGPA